MRSVSSFLPIVARFESEAYLPSILDAMEGAETAMAEARAADIVSRFHREQQGHVPSSCKATLLPDMLVVVCGGIFTSTETTLSTSAEGLKIIQSARREQRALTRRDIERRVGESLGRPVNRSYYDLDVRLGEQIEIYILS